MVEVSLSKSTDFHDCNNEPINYISEIQQMMHGFGDVCEPLVESARIIEDIVLRQMRASIEVASKVAERRGSSTIDTEDFLFLLRKDVIKLQRLIKYLDLKDFKASIHKATSSEESDFLPNLKQIDEPKKVKRSWESFLEALDTTNELNNGKFAVDHVKHNRCIRAEMMSKNLDESHYIEYSKARNVSFANRHRHKFNDWVIPNGDVNVSKQGYVILSYLAYETVAQIIDLAFLVRHDQSKLYGDILDRLRLNYYNPQTYKPHQHCKSSMTKPISPAEINEALRRYWSPQLEMTGPFHRWSLRKPHLKFLAC